MRQTNLELVTEIMEFSAHGAMSQLVVMEAIGRYVNRVVDGGLEKLKDIFGEHHFISPEAWFATCEEIKKKLDKRKEGLQTSWKNGKATEYKNGKWVPMKEEI